MSKSVCQVLVDQRSARINKKSTLLATSALTILSMLSTALAQDSATEDVIVVTGIRSSLANALVEKRESNNIVEVIQAEDIGKLPDQNLAEVLENITGIQITRTAGIGTAVQIRGTGANRVEINGVSTVSSGAGRSGISFEDLPASLISSVEVIKVPTPKTIEGSVGGTINLRTIRPLDLTGPLIAGRVQFENSDLAISTLPRLSATLGNNWSTGSGEFGVVLSGSYARQDVAAFIPRVNRDGIVLPDSGLASAEAFPFLRIQFFDQRLTNFAFETYNFNGSLEWKPSDNLKFYFDATLNQQDRASESTRVSASGVSGNNVVDNTTNTSFETVDFGTVEGPDGPINLGSFEAVLTGILEPGLNTTGGLNPNLRTSSNNGARLTTSQVFGTGAEWQAGDRLTVSAEVSLSTSKSTLPGFSTVLDFINPNSSQPSLGESLDNGVPLEFDLNNDTLQFGIAEGLATTPTTAQLLDPANYQLRQIQQNFDTRDNKERAGRLDFSYDTADIVPFITSIDAGYRWNRTTAVNEDIFRRTNFTNTTSAFNRPSADLFSDLIIAGPNNFDGADGRRLFFPDFLIVDGGLLRNQEQALASINAAITASNAAATVGPAVALIAEPESALGAFFSISETTNAAYFQANFNGEDLGLPVRGSAGVRWVSTRLSSIGNNVSNGVVAGQIVENSSYNFFLPRFSAVIEPADDILIRAGVARDIRRPDFDSLSTSIAFQGNANSSVVAGNPALVPESVWSFDVSGEWYFAPSSLLSVGFFHKIRTNLFAETIEFPPNNIVNNELNIDITPPCEDGGIFNPIADRNINNPIQGVGICVPLQSTFNVAGTTTQTGIEVAFQHDLSAWEDRLGFASGFGFIGNFTYQETGGSAQDFRAIGGRLDIFTRLGIDNAQQRVTLLNLSRISYNTTLYYDKHGLSARARYTWRSSNQSEDAFQVGAPLVNGSRGQLNASVNYAISDNITVGVEGINLFREDQRQFCINNNSLLCFNSLTDRRLIAGVSLRF